ncbi:MAG TPA: hypothetical protein VK633_10640 [Verrucomicrobiae bacterium]|nr:hypothetical protein [Verrucomicrobiae bacterium]
MILVFRFTLLICLGTIVFSHGAEATDLDIREQILFLHLRSDTNGLQLLRATVRPGHLKRAMQQGTFEIETIARSGTILHTNQISDPTIQRLEFEDPATPGKILQKKIVQREFTLRLPYNAAAGSLRFYKKSRAISGGLQAESTRQFLGQIALPIHQEP